MQLFDLKGKTVIITGASSGLGEQFARCLSGAGARVVLAARRVDKLNALASELDNAKILKMDVADKNSVQKCFSELDGSEEQIDICINNAGIFKATPVFEEDHLDDFESVMQTNVMGVWYVAKAAANHMKKRGTHGSIINISSVNGANYLQANRVGYCASKAAVIQMTKALVGELSPSKIRVNCIVPGPFHTAATDYKVSTPELRENLEASIPLEFFAKPSDLDGVILYLASNQASRYVTGSIITVDGGISWGGKS
jgi:NAD(P)-dependent dehydrogenase (short-subunit alcohol dehydrogenase family)